MIVADFKALVRCCVLILAAVYLFDVLRYTCTTLSDANLNLEFILNGEYAYRTRVREEKGSIEQTTNTLSRRMIFPANNFPMKWKYTQWFEIQKSDRQRGKVEREMWLNSLVLFSLLFFGCWLKYENRCVYEKANTISNFNSIFHQMRKSWINRKQNESKETDAKADSFLISIDFVFYENKLFLYCILARIRNSKTKHRRKKTAWNENKNKKAKCVTWNPRNMFICMFC